MSGELLRQETLAKIDARKARIAAASGRAMEISNQRCKTDFLPNISPKSSSAPPANWTISTSMEEVSSYLKELNKNKETLECKVLSEVIAYTDNQQKQG